MATEATTTASGPPGRPIVGHLFAFRADPIGFLTRAAAEHGDVVPLRIGPGPGDWFLVHPDAVEAVLVDPGGAFAKPRGLRRAVGLLGDGILTAEGEVYRRHRAVVAAALKATRTDGYGRRIVAETIRWTDGLSGGAALDLHREMGRLALVLIGATLFEADLRAEAPALGRALDDFLDAWLVLILPGVEYLDWLPLPVFGRVRRARATFDALLDRLLSDRRASPGDDLLSSMIGAGFDDRAARDGGAAMLLAGHENTANALAWTWHLLAGDPEVEGRLHDEVDGVAVGRDLAPGDLADLRFVRAVVAESLRLYPPAWIQGRRARRAVDVGGLALPAGATVVLSPYVTGRDGRFFDDPLRFDPDRWLRPVDRPPYAFFPFGGGPRRCLGEAFAWMELVLVVATVARRWSFEAVPGRPVEPRALLTLRPAAGVPVVARRRGGASA